MEQKRKRNILVTGGNGFIGWNFLKYLTEKKPISYENIVNVDAEDYASTNYLSSKTPNYSYYQGRMKDMTHLIDLYNIDLIFNFAAHTHVDNSIKGSKPFIQNNVLEMCILAERAKECWERRKIDGLFVQISTDEVFGSVENQDGVAFNEYSSYHPNNPYAASKTSAEMMLHSFGHTYNFPYIITNCSNNYGPGQHKEKLIPKIISNVLNGEPVPIYGDGQQRRDWIYVEDHCEGVVVAALHGKIGESYLFGTNKTVTNLQLTKNIIQKIDSKTNFTENRENLITHVSDRLGHDVLYRTDYTKSYVDLGWYPKTNLWEGLDFTIDWYLTNWKK